MSSIPSQAMMGEMSVYINIFPPQFTMKQKSMCRNKTTYSVMDRTHHFESQVRISCSYACGLLSWTARTQDEDGFLRRELDALANDIQLRRTVQHARLSTFKGKAAATKNTEDEDCIEDDEIILGKAFRRTHRCISWLSLRSGATGGKYLFSSVMQAISKASEESTRPALVNTRRSMGVRQSSG